MTIVGDLSIADINVLSKLARQSSRILEFGVGGSTQLFAQWAPRGARIVAIDTDPDWIARTATNLARLKAEHAVEFFDYEGWHAKMRVEGWFDLIFDDGLDAHRQEFALQAWGLLAIGGTMVFHDTRRPDDFFNVLHLLHDRYLEIDSVQINTAGSNLTVVTKKAREPWVNWNTVEGREPWESGYADPPADWPFAR